MTQATVVVDTNLVAFIERFESQRHGHGGPSQLACFFIVDFIGQVLEGRVIGFGVAVVAGASEVAGASSPLAPGIASRLW